MQRNDWLEDEEEELARNHPQFQPSEEAGFTSLAGAVQRTVAVAGAARAIAPDCESPIEATLGARLKLLIDRWNSERVPQLELIPQYPLFRFRYDFGVASGGKLIVAIECDGKDYHDSDQARANDAAKNVAVWTVGAEIFRFTGSAIFRHDADCAADVEAFLLSKFKSESRSTGEIEV